MHNTLVVDLLNVFLHLPCNIQETLKNELSNVGHRFLLISCKKQTDAEKHGRFSLLHSK